MPRRSDVAQIAFGDLFLQQPPLDGIAAALEASLVPGTRVERYDRVWRMGQWSRQQGVVVGRIGFDAVEATEIWDDGVQDFVQAPARAGQTSPFAIDPDTLRVAFQLRHKLIRPQTFRGNFQALLRAAADFHWIVRLHGVQQPPWEEWLQRVTRIKRIRVNMQRPNPRFPSKVLEDFFDQAKLAAANLVTTAEQGMSIDVESNEFLRSALENARDYGNYQAEAELPSGETDTWKSALEGQVETVEVSQEGRSEVPAETLRETLGGGDGPS